MRTILIVICCPNRSLLEARITVICQYWWLSFKLWNLSFTCHFLHYLYLKSIFLWSLTLSARYFFCLELNLLVWACNYNWSVTLGRKSRQILGSRWTWGVFQVDLNYHVLVTCWERETQSLGTFGGRRVLVCFILFWSFFVFFVLGLFGFCWFVFDFFLQWE